MSYEPQGETAAKHYTEVHGTNVAEFRTLALEAAELANTISILKDDLEEKRKLLQPYLVKSGVKSVIVPQDEAAYKTDPSTAIRIRVTLAAGKKTNKLSTEKLIKLGVKPETIMAATSSSTGEPSIRITTSVTEEAEAA